MKKIALLYTTLLTVIFSLSATTNTSNDYGRNSGAPHAAFIFTEANVEFSIFPDGQFDFYALNHGPIYTNFNGHNRNGYAFSMNTGYDYGPYVQYDDYGAVVQIENVQVDYDYYGRITRAGRVKIKYNNYGFVERVGKLKVHYNPQRVYTHYSGYVNDYNRRYIYRPWHNYYRAPSKTYVIVYSKPYRQYYKPVRHTYYRPYSNNHRQKVTFNDNNSRNPNFGRRENAITTRSVSDRYKQNDTPRRTSSSDNSTIRAHRSDSKVIENKRGNSTVTPRRGSVTNGQDQSRATTTARSTETPRRSNVTQQTKPRANVSERTNSNSIPKRAATPEIKKQNTSANKANRSESKTINTPKRRSSTENKSRVK